MLRVNESMAGLSLDNLPTYLLARYLSLAFPKDTELKFMYSHMYYVF